MEHPNLAHNIDHHEDSDGSLEFDTHDDEMSDYDPIQTGIIRGIPLGRTCNYRYHVLGRLRDNSMTYDISSSSAISFHGVGCIGSAHPDESHLGKYMLKFQTEFYKPGPLPGPGFEADHSDKIRSGDVFDGVIYRLFHLEAMFRDGLTDEVRHLTSLDMNYRHPFVPMGNEHLKIDPHWNSENISLSYVAVYLFDYITGVVKRPASEAVFHYLELIAEYTVCEFASKPYHVIAVRALSLICICLYHLGVNVLANALSDQVYAYAIHLACGVNEKVRVRASSRVPKATVKDEVGSEIKWYAVKPDGVSFFDAPSFNYKSVATILGLHVLFGNVWLIGMRMVHALCDQLKVTFVNTPFVSPDEPSSHKCVGCWFKLGRGYLFQQPGKVANLMYKYDKKLSGMAHTINALKKVYDLNWAQGYELFRYTLVVHEGCFSLSSISMSVSPDHPYFIGEGSPRVQQLAWVFETELDVLIGGWAANSDLWTLDGLCLALVDCVTNRAFNYSGYHLPVWVGDSRGIDRISAYPYEFKMGKPSSFQIMGDDRYEKLSHKFGRLSIDARAGRVLCEKLSSS